MTRVTFYFNAEDKASVAMRLAGKAWATGQHVLVFTPDAGQAEQLDKLFWTSSPLNFLPHVQCTHPLASRTPILIGNSPDLLPSADVLINLSDEPPAFFGRFDRLLEVVGCAERDRELARTRFRYFRERGYAVDHHDLSGSA